MCLPYILPQKHSLACTNWHNHNQACTLMEQGSVHASHSHADFTSTFFSPPTAPLLCGFSTFPIFCVDSLLSLSSLSCLLFLSSILNVLPSVNPPHPLTLLLPSQPGGAPHCLHGSAPCVGEGQGQHPA